MGHMACRVYSKRAHKIVTTHKDAIRPRTFIQVRGRRRHKVNAARNGGERKADATHARHATHAPVRPRADETKIILKGSRIRYLKRQICLSA